jgi:hypothetical protein
VAIDWLWFIMNGDRGQWLNFRTSDIAQCWWLMRQSGCTRPSAPSVNTAWSCSFWSAQLSRFQREEFQCVWWNFIIQNLVSSALFSEPSLLSMLAFSRSFTSHLTDKFREPGESWDSKCGLEIWGDWTSNPNSISSALWFLSYSVVYLEYQFLHFYNEKNSAYFTGNKWGL